MGKLGGKSRTWMVLWKEGYSEKCESGGSFAALLRNATLRKSRCLRKRGEGIVVFGLWGAGALDKEAGGEDANDAYQRNAHD